MKKIASIFLCASLVCICVVPVSAADVITKPNQTLKDVKNPLVLDFDGKITIDEGAINRYSSMIEESAIKIAPGRDVTIVIPGGKTLYVEGGKANGSKGAGAGIEVPENSSLTIIGSGTLKAYGGSASVGCRGQNGEDAYIEVVSDAEWYCHSGAGGDGGAGGGGGGAAIGSRGGDGGAGGKGGAAVVADADSSVYHSGNAGGNGTAGSRPANFGKIRISNNIHLTAKGGEKYSGYSEPGNCGASDSKQDWWYYAAYGGGGGGQGGAGCQGRGIGSGGYGGGGAGGGGSGLTYRFYYKTSLDAADGTGQGGDGGYGNHSGNSGGQKENKGLDAGYGGGAGGERGLSDPHGAWDAQDIFFDESLVGSIVSSGSLPIVIGGACVALALVIFVVIKKKKTN